MDEILKDQNYEHRPQAGRVVMLNFWDFGTRIDRARKRESTCVGLMIIIVIITRSPVSDGNHGSMVDSLRTVLKLSSYLSYGYY